uniref:Ycf1 n=1 Tax=Hedysarum polybotrys var. alaschanicum TaxID=2862780 RepID=A0A8F8XBN1_9FABA|nr:Ycf1 [Hedysarum polybotrys var. alaschanicum]
MLDRTVRTFILENFLKLMNSVVVAGLYFGFLMSLFGGPSNLFLIRARVMEKGREKKIAATTGFITGKLMMFISIYYAPLYVGLSRPHTITALILPYLFFNFLDKNDKHYFLNSGYNNSNSIRKFSVYKVFFNHLVFQLLNPCFFSSSIFIRLVNIYLFRCNNKLLFLTSSSLGWLIGHIFCIKCIGLILVWLQQHNSIKSIKSRVTIRFDKYIMLEFRNYAGQLFAVFSLIILFHYLCRIPLPYCLTEKSQEIEEGKKEEDEKEEDEKEEDEKGEDEIDSETEKTKQEQNESLEEDTIEEQMEKPLRTTLFDFKRWNRPLRYIKNDHFENFVRNENSQFFFHICQSDGKERISFTYPPNLSAFLKIMEKKMDLFTRDKISYNELSNSWSSANLEKRKKLSNEFLKRAKVLDKGFSLPDVLENRIRLCNDEKIKYLPKIYDPFLNGRFRGRIEKSFSPSIENETDATNSIFINKIHGILLSSNSNSPEFEQKMDPFDIDKKSVLTEIGFFFNLISKFSEKSVSSLNFDGLYLFPEHEQVKIYSEEQKRKKEFLLDAIRTDLKDQTIFNEENYIEINEIRKNVPRWSFKLISDLEQLTDSLQKEPQIRSRDANRIVIFTKKEEEELAKNKKEEEELAKNKKEEEELAKNKKGELAKNKKEELAKNKKEELAKNKKEELAKNKKEELHTPNLENTDDNEDMIDKVEKSKEKEAELALLKYSREPDFARDLIRGSMRAQRRKTVPLKEFQSHPHSPLFLYKIQKYSFFFGDLFDDISQYLKEYFRKQGTDNSEFLAFEKRRQEDQKEGKKNDEDQRLIEIEEAWESILYGLTLRSFVIIAQSYLRKYIILPSLIIAKNIIRIVLFQDPEWSEDFRDWKKEVHIKCTYQGIPVSSNKFPQNWVTEGLQIRILSPFVLKPWRKSEKVQFTEKTTRSTKKKRVKKKNLWILTACGTQIESYLDYYIPNPFSFLGPIFKKIKKQWIRDFKNRFSPVISILNERKKEFLTILNERKKEFLTILNEIGKWNIKSILFGFQNRYELSESKKNSTISKNNPMIYESPVRIQSSIYESPVLIQSSNWINSAFTEKRIRDLNLKTMIINKQIEKMNQEKNGEVITSEKNLNSNRGIYANLTFYEMESDPIFELQKNIFLIFFGSEPRFELLQNIFRIFRKINVRLSRKSYSFFKIFMEKIYMDILLWVIHIPRINVQLFLESTKKSVNKSISKKKTNAERIDKTNQSIIPFMSIIQKSCNSTNKNSQNSCDVSSLSQAYVFFKLSQTLVSNVYNYKLRSIFESHESSFFLKNEIKDYFLKLEGKEILDSNKNLPVSDMHYYMERYVREYEYQSMYPYPANDSMFTISIYTQKVVRDSWGGEDEIFDSKFRCKNRPASGMTQWTNWLKTHYQYDLPESSWSRLVPQNWRNGIHKHRVAQNKDLIEYDSDEKTPLILCKKQQLDPDLLELKKKIKKQYRYDLLSYKYINYAEKKKSYIYGYRSPFNDNTRKKEFLDITGDIDISIQNYIAEDVIIDRGRKYLDWKVIDLPWKVMNVEIKNHSIANPKFGFFSKLGIFCNAYMKNPWIMPIKSLVYGKEFDENGKEIKKTDLQPSPSKNDKDKKGEDKKKTDLQPSPSKNDAKTIGLKRDRNDKDKKGEDKKGEDKKGEDKKGEDKKGEDKKGEDKKKTDLQPSPSKNDAKTIGLKRNRNNLMGEQSFLLKKYLGFHLNSHSFLQETIMNNIQLFCFLIRLKNLKKFFIISIQKGDLNLDTMAIQNRRDFTFKDQSKSSKKQIFFMEPVRLARKKKNYEQFFMYQTISLSLIHTNKRKIFPRKPEKSRLDKNHYDLLVPENILSSRRRRELRILMCFNRRNTVHRNTINENEKKINNSRQVLAKKKDLDRETKKRMNLKFFLWPNYRLEDLACINRYWFDTHNGSRFSILRTHMYPRLKI